MLSKLELQVIDDYLDAPYGSLEAQDALRRVIEMVDARRHAAARQGALRNVRRLRDEDDDPYREQTAIGRR
jgi:hypothetical protein